MADRETPKRVTWSPQALDDLAKIYRDTTYDWGLKQAERYNDVLHKSAEELASNPQQGRKIETKLHLRAYFTKWPKAKNGHYLIFTKTEEGIYILRVLHSSMDLENRLQRDQQ